MGLHREAGVRLGAAGGSLERAATHVALGAEPGDGEAVTWLRRGAASATSRAPATAVRLLERARRDRRSQRSAPRCRRLRAARAAGADRPAAATRRWWRSICWRVRRDRGWSWWPAMAWPARGRRARYPEAIEQLELAAGAATERERQSMNATGAVLDDVRRAGGTGGPLWPNGPPRRRSGPAMIMRCASRCRHWRWRHWPAGSPSGRCRSPIVPSSWPNATTPPGPTILVCGTERPSPTPTASTRRRWCCRQAAPHGADRQRLPRGDVSLGDRRGPPGRRPLGRRRGRGASRAATDRRDVESRRGRLRPRHLRPCRLPPGDKAGRGPRRSATPVEAGCWPVEIGVEWMSWIEALLSESAGHPARGGGDRWPRRGISTLRSATCRQPRGPWRPMSCGWPSPSATGNVPVR